MSTATRTDRIVMRWALSPDAIPPQHIDHTQGMPVTLLDVSTVHLRAVGPVDTVALRFPRPLTEDEDLHLFGLIGYAWKVVNGGTTGVTFDDAPIRWIDDATVAFWAPMWRRRGRTSPESSMRRFLDLIGTYCAEGTTERKDGTRLVEPLGVSPAQFFVG